MQHISFGFLIVLLLSSCNTLYQHKTVLAAPEEVRERALSYAYQYLQYGTEYKWGGQDELPKVLKIDCSGLVINCYKYACQDYGYRMLFSDTTAYGLTEYTTKLQIDELNPGDLLFMGTDGNITHVAMFVRFEGDTMVFIDSTEKPEAYINGVSERAYPKNDPRFISFGRMLIGS